MTNVWQFWLYCVYGKRKELQTLMTLRRVPSGLAQGD
jgi:hypothetical protein